MPAANQQWDNPAKLSHLVPASKGKKQRQNKGISSKFLRVAMQRQRKIRLFGFPRGGSKRIGGSSITSYWFSTGFHHTHHEDEPRFGGGTTRWDWHPPIMKIYIIDLIDPFLIKTGMQLKRPLWPQRTFLPSLLLPLLAQVWYNKLCYAFLTQQRKVELIFLPLMKR